MQALHIQQILIVLIHGPVCDPSASFSNWLHQILIKQASVLQSQGKEIPGKEMEIIKLESQHTALHFASFQVAGLNVDSLST